MDKCPKCGATDREQGAIYQEGTGSEVRYQRQGAFPFGFKKEIVALACLSCGHIELLLKDAAGTKQE